MGGKAMFHGFYLGFTGRGVRLRDDKEIVGMNLYLIHPAHVQKDAVLGCCQGALNPAR